MASLIALQPSKAAHGAYAAPAIIWELLGFVVSKAAHGVLDPIKHTLAGQVSPASLKEGLNKPGAVKLL